ncbi:ABC transporter ATP-binding protein [Desulfobaculum bizertense]|uniref:ABC transporter ATP-binding protein n=1 Tax=Desulfobaculum bizertense TaxID=376490 RepID=UPI001F3B0C78|nr:ABC transporter ATP-binding protein [Desulfobaculum bizertense]UIJ37633.1 ABC transporter ATP-binding protein [Desulfobaculum bizertense]
MQLLTISDLQTQFFTSHGVAHAVDGVSLHVDKGEPLAIVGESGCGKTMLALSIMRLVPSPPGKIVSGSIRLGDTELLTLPEKDMQRIRGNRIGMIFQEPMTSLNPVFKVGEQIAEALRLHRKLSKKDAKGMAVDMLHAVGIPEARRRAAAYPHELSGGMRQRVVIAMALACDPELVLADEPTTALDVTIQAQILELMMELQHKRQASVIYITHDLGVVAQTCTRVAVMYAGHIVEESPVEDIFHEPLHPYTKGLMRSVPRIDQDQTLRPISGLVPNLYDLPTGCRFHPRCPYAMDKCREQAPELVRDGSRTVRCWLHAS